ncbi:hypothetical protein NC653_012350 [Populus alba x Populus x berolinensis]|uniref:Uncharacterized protein n=1 Tax=Populus alba x Populus x berolinensis TaxID=444605 RepID=A0AAD6W7N4_9ROSI|nr:hypothetical protein NC653_012346 [Populus alba x Populus x berolinensis]KAJ7002262.1 hypothetical protein NC653_012350 [Populus alba x Populus x berolinensis]
MGDGWRAGESCITEMIRHRIQVFLLALQQGPLKTSFKQFHSHSILMMPCVWQCLIKRRACPSLSYIMFADDTFLFGKACMGAATCIMQALQVYSQASGKELTPFQKQCLFIMQAPRFSQLTMKAELVRYTET